MKIWIGLGLMWAAISGQATAQLPARVSEMLRISNMPETALGVAVIRLADGKLVWSQYPNQSMQPASTIKVLTAIVGLDKLGPAYRSRTEISTSAPIVGDQLNGDLVIRGEGNTDISWEDFSRMLQAVRQSGIREIRGNVVIDRTFFNPPRLDIGVPPFDETPEFRYNVIPDALLINMNLAQFDIASTDNALTVRLTPQLSGVKVISNMSLIARACEKWEEGWKRPTTVYADDGEIRVHLEGEFPQNCAITTNLNVIDRAEYTSRLFRNLWTTLGGAHTGRIIEAPPPSTLTATIPTAESPVGTRRVLAEHRARPLAEVSRNINKVSDNAITRMVFLTLGARADATVVADKDGSLDVPTIVKGEQVVRKWLQSQQIDDADVVLDNGSGLSRRERISPKQLAAVLAAAHRSKWAPEFLSSLPIVAVDGSMRSRLKDSPAAETARIKTGGLRNVVSVAGYVTNVAGEVHAVVGMVNHDRAALAGGRAILDALLDEVARSNATPVLTK